MVDQLQLLNLLMNHEVNINQEKEQKVEKIEVEEVEEEDFEVNQEVEVDIEVEVEEEVRLMYLMNLHFQNSVVNKKISTTMNNCCALLYLSTA